MRERLPAFHIYYHSDSSWSCYLVGGAIIVSQLNVQGRVYLSMVLPCLFNDSHSSVTVQACSSAESACLLNIVKSARNLHISDSDLDSLKMVWDMCHSQIQRLSKEDGIPLLKRFLTIRTPYCDNYFDSTLGKVYFGRIFGQYRNRRHKWGLFSESTAHRIGQIKLRGQPTLEWYYSTGWTEVTTGLWRRR